MYHPAIQYRDGVATSQAQFARMAFSVIVRLAMQVLCLASFAVATPAHWREITTAHSAAVRLLRFVHHFDGAANGLPSTHVSVATLPALPALHASAMLRSWASPFPARVAVSCASTKPHCLIDLPFGAALRAPACARYTPL